MNVDRQVSALPVGDERGGQTSKASRAERPGGTLQCEGSAGPVDLFAEVADKANGLGFWHTHVLAELSLVARVAKTKVALTVGDAGDPVAGATISVGGRRERTAANGRAGVTLRPGSFTAIVAAPGYATGTAKFTVR